MRLTTGNAASGGTVPRSSTAAGSTVYFAGFDPTYGFQLWVSNGTAGGTTRLTTGNTTGGGLNPQGLTAMGSTVYFSGNDGVHGTQLWSSTGTTPGTTMLTSVNVAGGGLSPTDLTAVGGTLYFAGDDGVHGDQLWSSNGTAAGRRWWPTSTGRRPRTVTNLTTWTGRCTSRRTRPQNGFQVWQSNGTAAGTVMDTSLSTGASQRPVGPDGRWARRSSSPHPVPTCGTGKRSTRRRRRRRSPGPIPAGIVYGTALSATQLDATASVPGTFTYSRRRDGAEGGQRPDAVGDLHAHRHHRLHHGDGDGDDRGDAGDADDHLGQPGEHRLRHGAVARRSSTRPPSVPGTFTYTPASGTVLGAGNDSAVGDLHAHRHHRLHHGDGDGDDRR